MNRIIITLIAALAAIATATAQNKIDVAVEQISAVGNCTFTSAVDRNPKTRKVEKVVKMLKVEGRQARTLIAAFRDEKGKGSWSENRSGETTTYLLTQAGAKANRVYMLRVSDPDSYPQAEATIIIKMK